MAEFCIHEKHGGICEKTYGFCNLGACPYEDLKEYATVRHGRWIEYTKVIIPEPYNKWEQAWKCSECGFDDGFVAYNFCPNCGAKMDIPDTEEDDDGDQAN